jgi:activator of 2-hydroxyglutaryl-CoA dehydratase
MNIVAGCDVGSLTSKAVVMKNGRIIGSHIIKSKPRPQDSANAALEGALLSAGVSKEDIKYCIGTGYGREKIGFVNENYKCASGTGRFLEVMAESLEVPLEELGKLSAESTEKLTISSQCVIFAETEMVSLVNEGFKTADILNALHHSLAKRVASLARSIDVKTDMVMTGGVAKNTGVFNALSEALGLPLKALDGVDPQIMGALGAALYADEKVREMKKTE